jgi:hypothetical protein
VRIYRCPRCRAEDISADAHPTRLLVSGRSLPAFVCRNCYRVAELEYRIACESSEVRYEPLSIREGLALLRDFYADRLDEWSDPALLIDEDDRERGSAPIRAAIADVERRLAIAPVT